MLQTEMKIEKLTQEQETLLLVYRDKWIKIGLCTEPANRIEAEKAIIQSYQCAGLKSPQKIIWCGSPLSQGLTRAIILDKKNMASVWDSVWASVWDSVGASVRASVWDSVGASVGDSVWASVWDSVVDSVGDSVWDSVGDSVGASVRASVWDSVGASVGDSVWASVWDSVVDSVGDSVWASVGASVRDSVMASVVDSVGASVWDSVGASVGDSVWASVWDSVVDSVGDSVWDSVGASVGASVYGQHDANWLGFYEYFRNVCGLKNETNKASGLIELAKNSGWFLPHKNICWVSERHSILNRDERGRLHSIIGPAVMYPDGWSIYAVHGVRISSDLIENKKSITVNRIEKEKNMEVRRVMIDLYGQQKYLVDSGAKEIHRDEFGVLYRKELSNDEPLVMVKVINSTPEPNGEFKDYFLRVPYDVQTAHEAVAWTYNKNKSEYSPEIET